MQEGRRICHFSVNAEVRSAHAAAGNGLYRVRDECIIGDFFEYLQYEFPVSYTNSGNKFERITANYEIFTNECIFNDTPSSDSFFEQVFDFSEKCEHDDNIDCMNTALQILKYK